MLPVKAPPARRETFVARREPSRDAPCPCGSGKKYKHCCYGKGVEGDVGLESGRRQPQDPRGTAALSDSGDKTTRIIVPGVIPRDCAELIMKR
jgi:hypothetical protein